MTKSAGAAFFWFCEGFKLSFLSTTRMRSRCMNFFFEKKVGEIKLISQPKLRKTPRVDELK